MDYTATYHSMSNDYGISMRLDATTDAQAVTELRKVVVEGYRNETRATVLLADGRYYSASNQHGNAVGSYDDTQ